MPPIISSLSTVRSSYGFARKISVGGGTVASTTDPYFNNVSLLLYGDGANASTNFIDSSNNAFAVTPSGSAQISTAQSKFGGASVYCPTNAYLTAPSNTKFQFGTGNFTIEFWVYLTGSGSLFSSALSSLSSTTLNCRLYSSGVLDIYTDGGAEYLSISSAVSPSTWTHLAFSRSGTTMRVFKDGNLIGSNTNWSNNLSSTEFYLNTGRDGSGEKYYDDFRVTKGVARYTANFTPPGALALATPVEPYFYNNSLLLTGDGPNASTIFADSSNNNFTLTPFGNVQISTAQSKFGGASMYFDGNSDYLTVADNAALQLGSGNFTIEFWIYFNTLSGYQTPFDKGIVSTNALLLQTGNGNGRMNVWVSSVAVIVEATDGLAATWTHYALVRNSGTLTLYRNGIQTGSVANTTNFNNTSTLGIGAYGSTGQAGFYSVNGYIDDLRITKGVARYTANFTPPGALLTSSDPYFYSNSLLLRGDGANGSTVFTDSSIRNFILTRTGNTQISTTQSKFGGASMYFDGNGDYLNTPANSALTLDGDFTIEWWAWKSADGAAGYDGVIGTASGASNFIELSNTRGFFFYTNSSISFSVNPNDSTWHHYAVTRSGSTVRLFIDGVLKTSGTASATFDVSGGYVGAYNNYFFNGYIDDFRVTKGIARYTANFTPPSAAFPDL